MQGLDIVWMPGASVHVARHIECSTMHGCEVGELNHTGMGGIPPAQSLGLRTAWIPRAVRERWLNLVLRVIMPVSSSSQAYTGVRRYKLETRVLVWAWNGSSDNLSQQYWSVAIKDCSLS